jgi:hypothetical protein
MSAYTKAPWQESTCNLPMWMGGMPAGYCGNVAYGHQLPERYLRDVYGQYEAPYCNGHACPAHGGPKKGDPIIFQDGTTDEGRPMWCAVMPGFIDLQANEAGFDPNPMLAVQKLRAAIQKATAGENE